jgi:hypothetical protein
MNDTVNQIKELVNQWELNDEKFQNGNASAGTRARKALSELAKAIKSRRKEITEIKTQRKEDKDSK